jgi:hypothetical protein
MDFSQSAPGVVGLPDPAADDEGRKRQMMAQLLMNSGAQSVGGGPMDALNKVASGALAGWQMGMNAQPKLPAAPGAPAPFPPLGG